MTYSLLIASWVGYLGWHSVLADTRVKAMAEKAMGKAFRYYRLGYSFISVTGLVGLMFLSGSIPGEYFFEPQGVPRYFSLILTTVGVMLIQASLRQHGLSVFLGFAPPNSSLSPGEGRPARRSLSEGGGEARLHTLGLLSWIRHPIHAGVILVTVGFFLFIPDMPTMVSCTCVLVYLPIGIFLEERKMVAAYGDAYRKYRDEVPALIPRWSRLRGS